MNENLNNNNELFNNYFNQYQDKNSAINKDLLIRDYVGNNFDKLNNGSFSWCSFFYGWCYLLYRKNYKSGFIFMFIWLVCAIMPILFSKLYILGVVPFFICLYFGFTFKSMYIKMVNVNIDCIIKNNSGSSMQQLSDICKKKGGVDKKAIILYIVIVILSELVINMILMVIKDKYMEGRISYTPVDELEYYDEITYGKKKYTYSEVYYKYDTGIDKCNLTLIGTNEYLLNDNNSQEVVALEYFKDLTDNDEVIIVDYTNSKSIRFNYYYDDENNTYYYFYPSINQTSILKYEIIEDSSGRCSELKEEVMNSVHYYGE